MLSDEDLLLTIPTAEEKVEEVKLDNLIQARKLPAQSPTLARAIELFELALQHGDEEAALDYACQVVEFVRPLTRKSNINQQCPHKLFSPEYPDGVQCSLIFPHDPTDHKHLAEGKVVACWTNPRTLGMTKRSVP